MPSVTAPDVSTGLTITFGTSGYTAEILSVTLPNQTRESIDITKMASTAREYMPGDLTDSGELEIEVHFNPDGAVPISGAVETITIAFDTRGADSTASSWAVSGFVTGHSPQAPLEDKMTASVTCKLTGVITKTLAT